MAKTTLDSLREHAPITDVLFRVVALVRSDTELSAALDAALSADDPHLSNVGARWLQKRQAYEITLVFDAAPWRVAEPDRDDGDAVPHV